MEPPAIGPVGDRAINNSVPTPVPGNAPMVDLPLRFETGPMKGRVAYNPQGQVAALYILVPDIG